MYPIVVLILLILWNSRRNKDANHELKLEKPEPFTSKQTISLSLVGVMIIIVLGFPMLQGFFPNVEWITFVNSKIDISFIALLLALVSYMLKLADPKEVTKSIPWNTIWLVCGVGVLVEVAVEAGAIEVLSGFVNSFPPILIPVAMCFIGGIMSFFSSTLGVVAPLMFPMVVAISITSGISPSLLFVATIIGAQSTTLAPFSTGGTLIMSSSALDDDERESLYHSFLYIATPLCLLFACVATLIIQMFF